MAETSCKCFVFLCPRSGEGLIPFNKNNRAIFSGEEKYNEEVFQGVYFAPKITVKLNLSSSSNLEVSNFAQHVPSRTAPQILNEPQNRKQLKVAAQDPLLHRPTLGLNHQGRYPWFLLCYCLGTSQLDYLVANEHP